MGASRPRERPAEATDDRAGASCRRRRPAERLSASPDEPAEALASPLARLAAPNVARRDYAEQARVRRCAAKRSEPRAEPDGAERGEDEARAGELIAVLAPDGRPDQLVDQPSDWIGLARELGGVDCEQE